MSTWYLLFWLKQVILLSGLSSVLFRGENANIWPILRDASGSHYLFTPNLQTSQLTFLAPNHVWQATSCLVGHHPV